MPDDITASTPTSYLNWHRHLSGEPMTWMVEAQIHTDATIIGQPEPIGPIRLINTIAHATPNARSTAKPAIAMRVAMHLPTEAHFSPGWKTEDAHYHGGDYLDELAALVSFSLGIRSEAGPVTRNFDPAGDPHGQPCEYGFKAPPVLLPLARPARIPGLIADHNLIEFTPLYRFPRLCPGDATAIVKVARMYQQAVWIADAQPALSWVLLVSAAEAAAASWWGERTPEPQRLDITFPELAMLLERHECSFLHDPLTALMAKHTKATSKLIGFLFEFMPDPPSKRPEAPFQFDFSVNHMRKALGKIYEYRSRALHGGIPFPGPMCEPPATVDSSGALAEIPLGLAARQGNATWEAKDIPMLLHTFEHIVRGALLNWLQSLPEKQPETSNKEAR
jgi:hypothetical protein